MEYKVLKILRGDTFPTHRRPTINFVNTQLQAFLTVIEIENFISKFINEGYVIKTAHNYELTQKGKNYLNDKFKQEQIYENIDEAIKYLKSNNGKDTIINFIENNRQAHEIQQATKYIIEKNNLIRFENGYINYAELQQEGYECEKIGIEKYLTHKQYLNDYNMRNRIHDICNKILRYAVNYPKGLLRNETAKELGIDINEFDGALIKMKKDGYVETADLHFWIKNLGVLFINDGGYKEPEPLASTHINVTDNTAPVAISTGNSHTEQKLNEESTESKELTKKTLKDFPKAIWYRKQGFIYLIVGIIVAVILGLLQLCNKN